MTGNEPKLWAKDIAAAVCVLVFASVMFIGMGATALYLKQIAAGDTVVAALEGR